MVIITTNSFLSYKEYQSVIQFPSSSHRREKTRDEDGEVDRNDGLVHDLRHAAVAVRRQQLHLRPHGVGVVRALLLRSTSGTAGWRGLGT